MVGHVIPTGHVITDSLLDGSTSQEYDCWAEDDEDSDRLQHVTAVTDHFTNIVMAIIWKGINIISYESHITAAPYLLHKLKKIYNHEKDLGIPAR